MYERDNEVPTEDYFDWLENVVSKFKKLTDKERNATFEALIENSTSRQYLYLSEKLGQLLTRDFLRLLPAELNYRILSHLDPETWLVCCSVSAAWNKVICSYQHGWREASISIGARLPKLPDVDFKCLYIAQKRRLEMISRGDTFEISIFEGHIGGSSAFYHWNGKLATGGTDGNVRIWDVASCEILQVFATGCSVSCGKFNDSILLTGNYSDKSIICWDMETCEEKYRFVGHTNCIECIDYDVEMDMLVSGSHDLSIKIWKLSTGQLLSTMDSLPATPIALHFMPDKSEPMETKPCSECAYTIVAAFRTYHIHYHYHGFFLRLNCRHQVIVKCDLKNLTTAYDLTSLSFGTLRAELAEFRAKTSRLPSQQDFQTITNLLPHEMVHFSSISSYGEHFGLCLVQNGSRYLVMFNRRTGEEITKVEVPLFCRYQILPGSDTLGSRVWMSGMDDAACRGLLFAIGTYGGEVMVIKWKSGITDFKTAKDASVSITSRNMRKESKVIELNPSRRVRYQISDKI